jgi:hypothetical protein
MIVVVVVSLGATMGGVLSATVLPSQNLGLQRSQRSERESRTAAQRKIGSQLLHEIYRSRGQAVEKNVPPGETGVKIDQKGRALVDVRAEVTQALEKKVASLGSTIVSTSSEYRSIIAWIPLLKLEELAKDPAVRAIVPAAEAMTNKPPQ